MIQKIKKKISQLLCHHNFVYLAKHNETQQDLWQCDKCNIYLVRHYGIGVSCKCSEHNMSGWIYEKAGD